jgi:very-short-patch-repair endonuclease
MDSNSFDAAIDRLASRQHGTFTHAQATAAGGTERMIAHRRKTGRWIDLDHGVYGLRSHPPTWHRQLKAAELSLRGAAIARTSAAVLHQMDGFRKGAIDLYVPRGGGRSSRLARVHHSRWFDTTTVQGVTVLTATHTLLSLMGNVPFHRLERALDSALVKRITTIEEVQAVHQAIAGKRMRGTADLGALIDDRLTGYVPPTNELERAAAQLLRDPRIPVFVAQAPFPWWPSGPFRVDFYIPSWRRIIEVDGRLWHTRFADFERDRQRDHLAQSNGVEVTRFTYGQVIHDPAYVLEVLMAIGARQALQPSVV